MSQARKTIPYRDKIVPLSIHKTLPYEDKILPLNKLDRAAPYDADYQAPTPPALTPQKDIPTFVPAPKKEKRDIDVKFWAKGLFVVAAAMIGLLLIAFYIRNHQRPEAPEAAESNNATPTVAAVDNPPVYTQPATPQPPVTAATPTALPPVATTQVAIATPPVVAPPPMATTPKGVPNPPVTARKNPTPPDSTLPKRPSGQSSLQGRLPTLPKTTAKDDWESTSIPK
jgi:cytoskeletal protein RodZ